MSDAKPPDERNQLITLDVRSDLSAYPWKLPPDVLRMEVVGVGLVPDGAGPGRASVALLAVGPNGEAVVAETTVKLARHAARSLAATMLAWEDDR